MYSIRTIAGILSSTFLIAIFLPLLFAAPQKAEAYRASDFARLMEHGGALPYFNRRPTRKGTTALRTIQSQHDRQAAQQNPVSSTKSYLSKMQQEHMSQGTNTLYSRSQQLMDVCRDLHPENAMLCYQNNRRIIQRQNLVISKKYIQ